MSIYEKLKELEIVLPPLTPPVAAFVPYVQTGKLVFISGHIARKNGKPWVGKVGSEVTREEAKQGARAVAIDLLAVLHAATGDLNKIKRIVKLLVLVNSDPSFMEPHYVANGASELFLDLFGESGLHARSAIGVAQLPLGACVEVEMIAEVV